MCDVSIRTPNFNATIQLAPSADFIGCMLTGVMAALPAFLEAFMRCLSGGEGSGDYTPGDRPRCATGEQPKATPTDSPPDK